MAPNHGQFISDPLAHFLAIPWAAKLLTNPSALNIVVSERQPLSSGDKRFVRGVMNGAETVRACVTFFQTVPSPSSAAAAATAPLSKSAKLLQGGGAKDGEHPERPFLLLNALLDIGDDLCGFRGTLHGGAAAVLLDETLCAAADSQSSESFTYLDNLIES